MNRRTLALTLVILVALAGCGAPDTLPSGLTASDRATVYEAVYVHKHAIYLYGQGQYQDAIAVVNARPCFGR